VKVAVYPADLGGCGYYRMALPAQTLIDQGADVDLIQPDAPPERQLHALFVDEPTPRVLEMELPDVDVVVVQRPLAAKTVATIEHLQANGIRVVVEIDDDFEAIDRRNISWPNVQPSNSRAYNRLHLRHACEIADLVTVTTPALAARYGGHGRVAVLSNYVPRANLAIDQEPHDGIYIGWSGSMDTHPTDLQQCGAGVAQAVAELDATFAVVGTGKGVQRALNLRVEPVACGWKPLDEYPEAMAQLDVGIVPLDLTSFNHAKSWLKGLEFASVGRPFVASPTGPYRALQARGIGMLASKPKHWRRAVLDVAVIADELGAAWREVVAREFTIEQHAQRWWDAWVMCLDRTPVAA